MKGKHALIPLSIAALFFYGTTAYSASDQEIQFDDTLFDGSNSDYADEEIVEDHHSDVQSPIMPWNINVLSTEEYHRLTDTKGEGVKVAVLDSGIDESHPDIELSGGENFTDSDKGYEVDESGHGTSISSVISLQEDSPVPSIAPNAELYSLKVFSEEERSIYGAIDALYWAIENDIDIVNMSFSMPSSYWSLRRAISAAHDAGILLVASAGNDGDDWERYPASYDEVVSVASITRNYRLSSFSTLNDKVEFVSPGSGILTARTGGGFHYRNGTSYSSTHIAGLASLYMSAFPYLSNDEIVEKMGDRNNGLTYNKQAEILTSVDSETQDISKPTAPIDHDSDFGDVTEEHWAYDYIQSVFQNNWMVGFDSDTFNPNDTITKSEAIAVASRIGLTHTGLTRHSSNINANLDKNSWSYPYLVSMFETNGFRSLNRSGYSGFNPNDPITRYELMGLLYDENNLVESFDFSIEDSFTDIENSTSPRMTYIISTMMDSDIVEGNAAGEINKSQYVTRAEASAMFVRYGKAVHPKVFGDIHTEYTTEGGI